MHIYSNLYLLAKTTSKDSNDREKITLIHCRTLCPRTSRRRRHWLWL